MTNPSRPASIGREACGGSSLWPWSERADDVERAERERGQRALDPAGDRGIDLARADRTQRLADRDGPRRARVRRRENRATDAEGDAEVGRSGPAEHGEREGGRDGAQPPVEVALVLGLRERDAAERRPEVDADPLGRRLPRRPRGRGRRRRPPSARRRGRTARSGRARVQRARPCGRAARSRRSVPRPATGTATGRSGRSASPARRLPAARRGTRAGRSRSTRSRRSR